MTSRNEARSAAELVIGNPAAHTPAELALAGMLLELIDSPVVAFEYDGTERRFRLDGGIPEAGVDPSYCAESSPGDAFKQLKLRVVELEFRQAQCERWHLQSRPMLVSQMILPAPVPMRVESYWLDRDDTKHAIGCSGVFCSGECRRAA